MRERTSAAQFRPYTCAQSQLEGMEFRLVSSDKSVMILTIGDGKLPGSYKLYGYVKSENRENTYFRVGVAISGNRNNMIPWSSCTCNDAHFRGNPCKHSVKMKDLFMSNREQFLKESVRR